MELGWFESFLDFWGSKNWRLNLEKTVAACVSPLVRWCMVEKWYNGTMSRLAKNKWPFRSTIQCFANMRQMYEARSNMSTVDTFMFRFKSFSTFACGRLCGVFAAQFFVTFTSTGSPKFGFVCFFLLLFFRLLLSKLMCSTMCWVLTLFECYFYTSIWSMKCAISCTLFQWQSINRSSEFFS